MALADTFFEGGSESDTNPDDKKYDEMFPNHPLSRCRRLTKHVFATMDMNTEKLTNLDPYVWPKDTA